ncbi:MarR family transcriptional regulator [Rheinheimera riviphila]|uniref:MarR family transcriptional regulator n=1 Tax=Rheinheimera riviphila TaxID=1834037 RepID=A0A437R053_9GAMM|nr:MarR family transcriptional regulator [Rheinheimera riviphila]RVU40138.1 MarR family transcriptional regulator [Rheinheimera riviphila]
MANNEKILQLLKTKGQQTSQQLADVLELTMMGARKHLLNLAEQGLVVSGTDHPEAAIANSRGRPQQYWRLTKAGHQYFPDRHADVSLQLIDGVRQLFGAAGLEQLIVQREQQQQLHYRQKLSNFGDLAAKVQQLAEIRQQEGYLAEAYLLDNGLGDNSLPEIGAPDGSWVLVEHHCPICAAATLCQNFCRSELQLFRACVEGLATVERTEHLLSAGSRCAYLFSPVSLGN